MIEIEELVKREAPSDSKHDRAYADELRKAYERYKGESRGSLIRLQEGARQNYRRLGLPSHFAVASCMVLNEMLERD